MKRFSKLLFTCFALIMTVVCCFSMAGCKAKIRDAQLELQIYDYSSGTLKTGEDVAMSIQLYSHLAPKTVEAMEKYIADGYYDNAIIYQLDSNKIMFGDLILDGDAIVAEEDAQGVQTTNIKLNSVKPTLPGEFEYGTTQGSDLTNKKGSIGLWRSYYDTADSYTTSSGMNSGRATWFMPTQEITSFNGYFCVFAQLNFEDESTTSAYNLLEQIFADSANYTKYVIYYTQKVDADGNKLAYDETKENANLEFHCVTKEYYDALPQTEKDKVFVASDVDGKQLVCYNKYEIKVPNNVAGKCTALVKGSSMVK